MQANFSIAEENYIKSIYHLQQEGGEVSTNALAGHLNTKAASVTDMLKKLQAKHLLNYLPYKGFKLSREGSKAALIIIRRHRLWEFFLVDKLHFNWEEVHEVAEELEHVRSKKLVDKLDEFLDYPKFDPHGDPIPDSNGKIDELKQLPLANLPLNKRAVITSVLNQSNELLAFLSSRNIAIGTVLEVKHKLPFDNSVEIKFRNRQSINISEQVAKAIQVNPL
ncbi:metal-dependent transcriptional regulator [Parafilimonas sp.]|uniref:metal-dependent transcriptional regulator n=1 Tax=Parafilimonas sp. TaxID=1969739 RepID=UPI0039E57759